MDTSQSSSTSTNNRSPLKGMTYTENGALAYVNTDSVLNFFSKVMARNKATAMDDETIISLLSAAWLESPSITLRLLAHLRDVRGDAGKGERHASIVCWKWLTKNHPTYVINNIKHIPFYGRWKDLLDIFCGSELEDQMIKVFAKQLHTDRKQLQLAEETDDCIIRCQYLGQITLAAKWSPTENCTYDKSAKKEHRVLPSLRMAISLYQLDTEAPPKLKGSGLMKWYRQKYLTPLRNALNLVETHLCAQDFDKIDFSKVPGVALKMYSHKTFPRHMPERFAQWQANVLLGRSNMNSDTVDPYELVKLLYTRSASEAQKPTLEAFYLDQIKVLKSKLTERYGSDLGSTVVMADVSGSMEGEPMILSIAMAIWISSIAAPEWRDMFFTFEKMPSIVDLSSCTGLEDRVRMAQSASWGRNTNLLNLFKVILDRAKKGNLSNEQMPKRVVVVSDMQFDEAFSDDANLFTTLETIKAMYRANGYNMPIMVFWNARGNVDPLGSPVSANENGVIMIGGFSKSLITTILMGDDAPNPKDVMMEVLMDKRYDLF